MSAPPTDDDKAPHQPLIDRLRRLEDHEPPPGWEARAEARWKRETAGDAAQSVAPGGGRWKLTLGAIAIAAAVAAIAIYTCRPAARSRRPQAPLAALLEAGDGAPRRGDGLVGDVWKLRAAPTHPHVELRVYRDRAMIVRCPGISRCVAVAGGWTLDLRLDEPGAYRAVALASAAPIAAPTGEGLDSDLLAARQAGAVITRTEAMTIQC